MYYVENGENRKKLKANFVFKIAKSETPVNYVENGKNRK